MELLYSRSDEKPLREETMGRNDARALGAIGAILAAAAAVFVWLVLGGNDRPGAHGWIYEYQGLIGGLLGFSAGALILLTTRLTIRAQAELYRRQRQERIAAAGFSIANELLFGATTLQNAPGGNVDGEFVDQVRSLVFQFEEGAPVLGLTLRTVVGEARAAIEMANKSATMPNAEVETTRSDAAYRAVVVASAVRLAADRIAVGEYPVDPTNLVDMREIELTSQTLKIPSRKLGFAAFLVRN